MDAAVPSDREILDRVSRSFALTIRALPRGLRAPVEIAYLLARAADTVADRDLVPPDRRRASLAALRRAVAAAAEAGQRRADEAALAALDVAADGEPADAVDAAERALLDRLGVVLARLGALPPADRADAAWIVETLAATMDRELAFFGAGAAALRALSDGAALEAYTEGIAGCVGEFWTRLVARKAPRLAPRALWLSRAGRRYGRGLQLVNVLRDLPRDLRRGRCFLPAADLAAVGLAPADLLDPGAAPRLLPVLRKWERIARLDLLAGLQYAAALPVPAWRLRFASVLPARIGVLTLRALAEAPPAARLDPARSIKVPRRAVRAAAFSAALLCLVPRGPLRLPD
ncbi:MAG: squalene/phytoene synthase family protein [Candidatus Polarisedimenticolia bacterium]